MLGDGWGMLVWSKEAADFGLISTPPLLFINNQLPQHPEGTVVAGTFWIHAVRGVVMEGIDVGTEWTS